MVKKRACLVQFKINSTFIKETRQCWIFFLSKRIINTIFFFNSFLFILLFNLQIHCTHISNPLVLDIPFFAELHHNYSMCCGQLIDQCVCD